MSLADLAEEFERRTGICGSLQELVPLIGDAGREIGFDHFALTICDNLRQTAPRFAHLDNYPPAYAEVFVANGLYRFDPVLLHAQRRIGGFAWDDVRGMATYQRELLDRAAREGLCSGYTVPANVPGEPCGAVSFASRRACRMTSEICCVTDFIARTAFEASRRLRGLSVLPAPVPHLATREIQCLRRLALGETDKQVARALGISPDTVRQYVKTARKSYRARTRAELIALALRDSQILFGEPSIPLFGGTDLG
ncbi:MAG: autoinducer binding domain-containing protein [Sphingomonas sp.]|uniref:helix-turn-helix transcriptional regulator n=1 Tax=Sphingomonas sp. TaxID=28214 RepID=UPI0025F4B221|nr:LuxR family transcriptional regulator [Sphingomonas sp.]MBX3563599.1 autoinducer binding domain-containing protein [Sphingomonas sp.]